MSKFTIPSHESQHSNDNVDPFFPRIRSMDEVIDNFFNQIVQYVIEDMILLEPKEEEELVTIDEEDSVVTKDYKELQPEDLVGAQISGASGSKIILTKSSTVERIKKKSTGSLLVAIKEEQTEKSSKTSTGTSSVISLDEERLVRIIFTNGNVYEGTIAKRIMNGFGKYTWSDGTTYEGEFKSGFATGRGKMTLPDLSHYEGEFNHGLFHGKGFLNIVSTPSFYSGQWQNGHKHGQGWLLYEPGEWYEGGWVDGFKEGFGLRHYKNGAKYRGMWLRGQYDGRGVMIWENNDYYKGQWRAGTMHGEGEYIWKAFYNSAFAFPVQNIYRGSWERGKRSGHGIMHFGDDTGLRLIGSWHKDVKHGDGYLVCGNGKVIYQYSLFQYDKPIEVDLSSWSIKNTKSPKYNRVIEFPIFSGPEYVDVGYYLGNILDKVATGSMEKLKQLKGFEEKCVRHVIVRYLPQLKELYRDYATIAAKTKLCYEPVMIRLFLWHFYKDIEIHKYGLSLGDTDIILSSNPKSCLDSEHDPFEPIYFWQFLMSLIGVAFSATPLETACDSETLIPQGLSTVIIKKFLQEIIFARIGHHRCSLLLNYMDLAPIKSVYSLYTKIGEPHSARTFLRESCSRRGEPPLVCSTEIFRRAKTKYGTNLVPLDQYVTFENFSSSGLPGKVMGKMANLQVFRPLGAKNIVLCLAKTCPLIMDENLVVNIDYPLTFLEFYETLLTCIFMSLEMEMIKEKFLLCTGDNQSASYESESVRQSIDLKRRNDRDAKRAAKKKKKKSI